MENLSDFLSIPNISINNDPVKDVYSSKVAQDPLVKETLSILEKALDEYGPNGVSMSFNGGKDCTMLLILVLAAMENFCRTKNIAMHPLRCLYIKSIDSFCEVDDFVDYCSNRFNLNVERYEASMKDGLKIFLDTNPISKAIVIGTRSTDPFGDKMKPFQSTDGEWPRIMRIHPILNWNYEDVWRIIRSLNIPYCKLYDLGYTSLGHHSDTLPNPRLKLPDGSFQPAHLLSDGSFERNGRVKKV